MLSVYSVISPPLCKEERATRVLYFLSGLLKLCAGLTMVLYFLLDVFKLNIHETRSASFLFTFANVLVCASGLSDFLTGYFCPLRCQIFDSNSCLRKTYDASTAKYRSKFQTVLNLYCCTVYSFITVQLLLNVNLLKSAAAQLLLASFLVVLVASVPLALLWQSPSFKLHMLLAIGLSTLSAISFGLARQMRTEAFAVSQLYDMLIRLAEKPSSEHFKLTSGLPLHRSLSVDVRNFNSLNVIMASGVTGLQILFAIFSVAVNVKRSKYLLCIELVAAGSAALLLSLGYITTHDLRIARIGIYCTYAEQRPLFALDKNAVDRTAILAELGKVNSNFYATSSKAMNKLLESSCARDSLLNYICFLLKEHWLLPAYEQHLLVSMGGCISIVAVTGCMLMNCYRCTPREWKVAKIIN